MLVHARPDAKLKGAVVTKVPKAARIYVSVLPSCVQTKASRVKLIPPPPPQMKKKE